MPIINMVYKKPKQRATQWPCPKGFHVPLSSEWSGLITVMNWLWFTTWPNFRDNLHLPLWWTRNYSSWNAEQQGVSAYYWTSNDSWNNGTLFAGDSNNIYFPENYSKNRWFQVRPFKNGFIKPTSSWTVISWTIWWAWIFRNQSEWIITITSDGTTGYTIADKNVWATTVWSNWDTLSANNCGWYFQRWNNYMFPYSWSITTSTTKPDASNYWPWNYYSSSTFIKWWWIRNSDWSSVQNSNLWWWVDGNVPV